MPNNIPSTYDFIFLGAGCASLSLLCRMADSREFHEKKILLLDRAPKNNNDRTWCFWEKEPGYFENIVHKQWKKLLFKSVSSQIDLNINPYTYKMIRGIDFYQYCLDKIEPLRVESKHGEITISNDGSIYFNQQKLETGNAIVFNSIYNPEQPIGSINLLQHFKGWVIETETPAFNSEVGTLMDFSISQGNGTAFVYVLPLGNHKALVEYTLFTDQLLQPNEYTTALQEYISNLCGITNYKIVEEEFGVIPMTNAKFSFHSNGIYNIGTAGGQTKPSTGYTFRFIQKQSDMIIDQLIKSGRPGKMQIEKRFSFYDNTFLGVLNNKEISGEKIFTCLFSKNKAGKVFKFLDNETNPAEELSIISSLPTMPFLKSAINSIVKN